MEEQALKHTCHYIVGPCGSSQERSPHFGAMYGGASSSEDPTTVEVDIICIASISLAFFASSTLISSNAAERIFSFSFSTSDRKLLFALLSFIAASSTSLAERLLASSLT